MPSRGGKQLFVYKEGSIHPHREGCAAPMKQLSLIALAIVGVVPWPRVVSAQLASPAAQEATRQECLRLGGTMNTASGDCVLRQAAPASAAQQPDIVTPRPSAAPPPPAAPVTLNPFPARGDTLDDWCMTAKLPSSIAICSEPELRVLTIERRRAYDDAKARLTSDQQTVLLADQHGWVKIYPQACGLSPSVAPPLPLAPGLKDCMARGWASAGGVSTGLCGSISRPSRNSQAADSGTPAVSAIGLARRPRSNSARVPAAGRDDEYREWRMRLAAGRSRTATGPSRAAAGRYRG